MKKIFSFVLAALIAASVLVSCNTGNGSSDQTTEGPDTTTNSPSSSTTAPSGDSTTKPDDTTASSEEETKHPGIDILKFELSDYVVIGDYKQTLISNVYCDDEMLAEQLKQLAIQEGYYTPVKDRLTAKGDSINISYAGRVEDVYFDGGTSDNATVNLVENNGYIDGFDADLYGIMPGTKVETTVTFPENYGAADLAGVEAVFEITVNFIYDYTLTDEQVMDMTSDKYKTVDELAEALRKSIIISNVKNFDENLNDQIFEMLLEKCEIKSYPEELVEYWYNDAMDYYEYYAGLYGLSIDDYLARMGMSTMSVREDAKNFAKEDLVLHAVFEAEGLTLSDEDYRLNLTRIALENGFSSADEIEESYGEFYMRGLIIKELCLEHLSKTLTVETDKADYEYLLEDAEKTTAEVTE